MSGNDRSVYQRSDGKWANKRDGAIQAASLHSTQSSAAKAAEANLMNSGGGELSVHGRDGRIRSKDTIGKSDPFPPRDREH